VVGRGLQRLVDDARRPLRLDEGQLEAQLARLGVDVDRELPVRGLLAAPLVAAEGRVIGFIQLSDKVAGAFTEEDELVVVQVAEVAAGLLENIRLYHELEEELSERRRAEDQLRASEKRLRTLAESSPSITVLLDEKGRGLYANRQWEAYFGAPLPEESRAGWTDFVHPDDHHRVTSGWEDALTSGGVFEGELRLIRSDGTGRWHLSRVVPVRGTEGVTGFCGTITDIHDLKEADRRKDEFLAMLAHELRNPLAAIRSATEVLRLAGSGEERFDRPRAVLDRQVRHMARLLDGLLEISRISRGKIELEKQTLDLREVVTSTLEDREHRFREKGLELESSVPSRPVWVHGDRVRLAQVLDNLVSNAIKFTPRPGRVTVRLELLPGEASLVVQDTGMGVPEDMLERIFEPFQQAETDAARGAVGLGLGLALARGLLELHGGRIRASSGGSGAGTEMQVFLPRSAAPALDAGRETPSLAGPIRILIVEDKRDAADMLRDLLDARGHEVRVAPSAAEALEALRAEAFDAVLSDLGLPGPSGYALARAARVDLGLDDILLIAVSGYGQPEDRARALEAGFDLHLVKPVAVDDLEAQIARVLAGRGGG
jgi:PAS domain S-box-containing protein